MMKPATVVLWLKIGSALTIFFGVLVAAAATPAAAAPAEFLADLIFFPYDGTQSLAAPESRLLAAIGGGVMAGWGLMMWLLATELFSREPQLTARIIISSIATWIVIDSTGSVLSGAPLNVAFNITFLLIFVVPLWEYRKENAAA